MKNFEFVCLHMWERSWLDIGQIDKYEDVNTVQQRRPHDRSDVAIATINSVTERNDKTRSGKSIR